MLAHLGTFNSFDAAYPWLISLCKQHGVKSAPRGMPITEILGASFIIRDATQGTCGLASRKLNYAFHVIEKWEYLLGVSDPERIGFYNPNMLNFLNQSTGQFDGAYGPRLQDQFGYVYALLKNDPDSRQAVLNINGPQDKHPTKDVPCTISLQFLLRGGKLNCVATMRSNDLLWGTPYDVGAFTFLQEAMAAWLHVEVGWYAHQAGSLHIYDSTAAQLDAVLADPEAKAKYARPKFDLGFLETRQELTHALRLEKKWRAGEPMEPPESFPPALQGDVTVVQRAIRRKLSRA